MSHHIRLGAFSLQHPISEGGMGTIWRAHHRHTGIDVAIKVISASFAQDPIYHISFEREVRAIAKLQHPRIVQLYDYGRVDSGAERASDGQLTRGSPWLAMELATHESLAQLPPVTSWDTLAVILFDILDALAHAHARGIVHRDLKPGNVLITRVQDELHCKLTDFGISHIIDPRASTREVFASIAGTPRYMAPEQFEGQWRDYGAWTDLYALGCLAYELASGDTPFTGNSVLQIAQKHLTEPPPPLQPAFDVPDGFVAWVDALLTKNLSHRYRRAADAAWALHQLAPHVARTLTLPAVQVAPAVLTADASVATTLTFRLEALSDVDVVNTLDLPPTTGSVNLSTAPVPRATQRFAQPPVPPTWGDETPTVRSPLPGAGLGLYRLREPPFTGREAERTLLWNRLRGAMSTPQVHTVVIRGESGIGKSSLARWLARRAHELGIASVMSAQHAPLGEPSQGVVEMVERYLVATGLSYERTFQRLMRNLGNEVPQDAIEVATYYAAALARYLNPDAQSPRVPPVQFASVEERYAIARTLITTLADRRGLVIVLDDVQWSEDTLDFALRLRDLPSAVLVILTVRTDELATRPAEAELLRELTASPNATTIDLEPLPRAEYGRLLDAMLWLEPTLREQVLDVGGSSPLFAAELISDWVRRRVLHDSHEGFRLDVTEEVPADLHELWNRRIDDAIQTLDDPHAARTALELAALLGNRVLMDEWRRACAALDVEIAPDLLDHLAAAELIDLLEEGWAFRHNMLQESIAHRARIARRARAHHLAIAGLLEHDDSPDASFRRAQHFLAVGDEQRAVLPLITTAHAMIRSGRLRAAATIAHSLAPVVELLPPGDRRGEQIEMLRLEVARRTEDAATITALVDQLRVPAREHNWYALLAHLTQTVGSQAFQDGDVHRSSALTAEALDYALRGGDPEQLARVYEALGYLEVRFGDLDTARGYYESAREHYLLTSTRDRVSYASIGLATCAMRERDFDAATRHTAEAIDAAKRGGFRTALSEHYVFRGDVELAQDDFHAAHDSYAKCVELAAMINNRHVEQFGHLSIGLVQMYLGDFHAAQRDLTSALTYFRAIDARMPAFFGEAAIALWFPAERNAKVAWDRAFESFAVKLIMPELTDYTLRAVDAWLRHRDPKRAAQALDFARALLPPKLHDLYEGRFDDRRAHIARLTQIGAP